MPNKTEPFRRSMSFSRAGIDPEKRTIEMSVSSETNTVDRYINGFGYVREILSHSANAINLERFSGENGGPLLYNHGYHPILGRFHPTGISDGKLRGTARFGKSAVSEEAWQNAQDGVLIDVSISYDYSDQDCEVVERDGNGKPTAVRVNRWNLYEVSMVTVPADFEVGIGRMAQPPSPEGSTQPLARAANSTEVRPMPPEIQTPPAATLAAPTLNAEEIRSAAHKDALSRVSDIMALGETYHVKPEKLREWIGGGASVDQVKSEILEGFRETAKPMPMTQAIGMSERDKQRYSLSRAALALADRNRSQAGFENEISQEVEKKLGRSSGGFLIPSDLPFRGGQRAANTQNTQTASQGGELVFKEYAGFVDLLKNETAVLKLGARLISGLVGNPTWVRQLTTTAIYWVGENAGADVADSKMTFSVVNAAPKTAKALASYTRQQLLQGVESIDQLLQSDLVRNHAIAMDAAALNGSGSSYQPTGLLNTAGVVPLALGTNGAVLTYDNIVDMETLLAENNNIQAGMPAYLTTPGIRGKMKKVAELANTNGMPIWRNDEMNGYPAAATNQMPNNLTKGTSVGTCHALAHGVFSELFILEWGALEMMADPYTLMGQDVVRLSTSHILDIFTRRPAAFVVCKDALKA